MNYLGESMSPNPIIQEMQRKGLDIHDPYASITVAPSMDMPGHIWVEGRGWVRVDPDPRLGINPVESWLENEKRLMQGSQPAPVEVAPAETAPVTNGNGKGSGMAPLAIGAVVAYLALR